VIWSTAAVFLYIALASEKLGLWMARYKFPLITGFLFSGIAAGPFGLKLLSLEQTSSLEFLDETSLGFIAFAAGSELHVKELKMRIKSIKWITSGLISFTFLIGSLSIFFLSPYIPFMSTMTTKESIAVSILCGSILVARSPSSAIAVIREMRAKGPFTQTSLGVTVIMDVIVIMLFALCSSLAAALFNNLPFNFNFAGLVILEFAGSLLAGLLLSLALEYILKLSIPDFLHIFAVLVFGYLVFQTTSYAAAICYDLTGSSFKLEPLLICMIASFRLVNYTDVKSHFSHILHKSSPHVYMVFFTLTGASLAVNVLPDVWPIALSLFVIRLLAIIIGSFTGGAIANEPVEFNKLWWMAFVTQAGVGLGLAKAVAVQYPQWGDDFATMMISLIILNQVVGPGFFKLAVLKAKEAHPVAQKSDADTIHSALIFGSQGQSLALARQLRAHDWRVKIACTNIKEAQIVKNTDIEMIPYYRPSEDELEQLGAKDTGAVICLLSDSENLVICNIVNDSFPQNNLFACIEDSQHQQEFHDLNVITVLPSTAIISLLDHYVRTPSAVTLLLGMEEKNDIIDVEVTNSQLFGLTLSDLCLPEDILVLSIHRVRSNLNVHSFVRFRKGDWLTLAGPQESLKEAKDLFNT
jgi:Trk K+ transport system NAD-binding subunit/Kef-type K+ transport system membrane component KefB